MQSQARRICESGICKSNKATIDSCCHHFHDFWAQTLALAVFIELMVVRIFFLFSCSMTISRIRLLKGLSSPSGYKNNQSLSVQVCSLQLYSSWSYLGAGYSVSLLFSVAGSRSLNHFQNTSQILLFWSYSPWKSDSLMVMAAPKDWSS